MPAEEKPCKGCDGVGWHEEVSPPDDRDWKVTCPDCNGTGKYEGSITKEHPDFSEGFKTIAILNDRATSIRYHSTSLHLPAEWGKYGLGNHKEAMTTEEDHDCIDEMPQCPYIGEDLPRTWTCSCGQKFYAEHECWGDGGYCGDYWMPDFQ